MRFAEWFVKMCAEKGVTTAEVASAVGVSAASTSYYASGRNMPKKTVLYKIEQFFGERFEEQQSDANEFFDKHRILMHRVGKIEDKLSDADKKMMESILESLEEKYAD